MYAGLPGRTQLENFVDIKKKLYICSNSTRHASRRTAYQGGSFALLDHVEVHENANGSA